MSKGTIGTPTHVVRTESTNRRPRYYCAALTQFGNQCANLVKRKGDMCQAHSSAHARTSASPSGGDDTIRERAPIRSSRRPPPSGRQR